MEISSVLPMLNTRPAASQDGGPDLSASASRNGLALVQSSAPSKSIRVTEPGRGLASASADLFRSKKWFVDRDEALVARLIDDCGATMERVEPSEHDAAVALTSHLPQLLSTALAAYLGEQDVIDFAGSGLQTFLRLAASDASVWSPIVNANRANIVRHLEGVLRVVRQILDGDSEGFTRAQELLRLLTR